MGYLNPILSYGPERFCADAAAAGVDGLIVVDLPTEEADLLLPLRQRATGWTSSAWSRRPPTTRACRMCSNGSSGFVYYVSITGITGTRSATAEHLAAGDPARPQGAPTCRSPSASACARRRRRRQRVRASPMRRWWPRR